MSSYSVEIIFSDGTYTYTFPQVYSVSDPKEGMKSTVHGGTRSDGSIVIPGGKRSQDIVVKGTLFDQDGYEDLTTLMNTMRTEVTTDEATLTMRHLQPPATWVNDWQYTVRRSDEIEFAPSLRTGSQKYSIPFLVISY